MDDLRCAEVNNINTTWAQCEFVLNITDCAYDGYIYNYIKLAYCDFGDNLRGATLVVLLSILMFLFLCMGITADDFLCPALMTISKTLRLSQNVAGVTFLAFGNGAPDIFSSISGLSQSKPQLIVSGLLGAGTFVTTVVVGSVLLQGEFEVMQRPIMRDIAFYIGATFMVWFIIYKSRIYLKHAIALVSIYICYIIVVVVSRYIYVKTGGLKKSGDDQQSTDSSDLSTISDQVDNKDAEANGGTDINFKHNKKIGSKKQRADSLKDGDVVLTRFYRKGELHTPRHSRTGSVIRHLAHHHFENTIHMIEKQFDDDYVDDHPNPEPVKKKIRRPKFLAQLSTLSTSSIISVEALSRVLSESKEFFIHICPIDLVEWHEYPLYKKVFEIVKVPPYFVMTLCIPVVDLESPKNNWCRLLNCINLICAPLIGMFFLGGFDTYIGDTFPVWALIFIISIIAALAVYFTSNAAEPPVYHRAFAFIGFGVSVLFINGIANEVINLLETLGIMFNLSDAILGLTILAWGNSLGDLISDLAMARHGYPSIGIAACFGGPLLNLLLGLGLPYTILLVDEPEDGLELVYNRMVTLLYVTITISLSSSLVLFITNRFHAKRYHGIYLIALYLVYLTFAILIESNVL